MDVDRSLLHLGRLAPYPVEQLRARKYAARLCQEIFQQPELGRSEMDIARASPHPARFTIKLEVAGVEAIGDTLGTTAAQQSTNPSHYLWNRERLDDVVVGSDRKAAHALSFLTSRSHHDDRECARILARPQPLADFDA
jgi:hypothetical protein